MLDCDLAQEIWIKSPLRWNTKERDEVDFGECCMKKLETIGPEERGLVMTITWGIWKARNKWVFDEKKEDI